MKTLDNIEEKIKEFRKKFGHSDFCKNFHEPEPKSCRCDFPEIEEFIIQSLNRIYQETEKESYRKGYNACLKEWKIPNEFGEKSL